MTAAADIPCEDIPTRHLALLDELAQIGMEVARAIGRQVHAMAPDDRLAADEDLVTIQGMATALDGISRSIRLTIMLHAQLSKPRHDPTGDPTTDRKATITRIIGRIGEYHGHPRDKLDRLTAECLEREFCGDVLERPMSDLIAAICNALGLCPKWDRLAAEDWAREEIASGDVGSPLKAYTGNDDALPLPTSGPSP